MALTRQDQYVLGVNGNLKERTEMTLIANAKYIAATNGGSNPTTAARRAKLAYLILGNPTEYAALFAKGIACQQSVIDASPATQADVSDATLDGVIAAIYDNYLPPAG